MTRHWRDIAALAIITLAMLLALSLEWDPEQQRLQHSHPRPLSGDEPHYILIARSLTDDHDLDLRNNYLGAELGGFDLGRSLRARRLDHHTILVDPRTGEHALWSEVFDPQRPDPRCGPLASCDEFVRLRSGFNAPDVRERPAHPVEYSVFLAAALYPFHVRPELWETRAVAVNIFFGWLGIVLTFVAARRSGATTMAAAVAAGSLALASPWLLYAHLLFPAIFLGVLALIALMAIVGGHEAAAGVAIVVATLAAPVMATLGVSWLILLTAKALRERQPGSSDSGTMPDGTPHRLRAGLIQLRRPVVFLVVLASGAALVVGASYWQAGVLLVSGNSGANLLGSFTPFRQFIDLKYGLWLFAPWTIVAFVALAASTFRREWSRSQLFIGAALAGYCLLLSVCVDLGGTSWGPRYLVPLLPFLALVIADVWDSARAAVRATILVLLVLGAAICIPASLFGSRAADSPPLAALWSMLSRSPLFRLS